jgi:diguanylate cyclase
MSESTVTNHALSPEAEMLELVEQTSVACKTMVSHCADQHASELADYFYNGMMEYPQASLFLNHTIVHERLHGSMQRWLRELFGHPHTDMAKLAAHQLHVGAVHARIQLPLHLVTRGARLLKQRFKQRVPDYCTDNATHLEALGYISQMMDLALELMSSSYLRNTEREVRSDEGYRLFSMGQNMAVERERQRYALLEWSQEALFTLHRPMRPVRLQRLSNAEFGLWFTHKAAVIFEGSPEIQFIQESMNNIDTMLLPQLQSLTPQDTKSNELIIELQSLLQGIKFQLATLFERQLEVENGRDALTRLLNRRFLPSVLSREIHLAQTKGHSFAALLLDIDHFKVVNDAHGHEAGDMVLQQAAAIVVHAVRNGDFVFRYGGEEVVVMLVEVNEEVAQRIAENIRKQFEATEFLIGQGRSLRATISIGLAMYDGHPDHQYLIGRADQAMYEAKSSGRNRICIAK